MDPYPSTEVNEAALERLRLDHRLKVGAGWFFWIAALTFINSIISLNSKQTFSFIVSLGTAQLINTLASYGFGAILFVLVVNTFLAGLFLVLGVKAKKAQRWAFTLGMILYGLDSLIFLLGKDYVGLLFHVFILLGLLGGLQALHQLQHLSTDLQADVPAEAIPSTVH
jgi:hypothetical protein